MLATPTRTSTSSANTSTGTGTGSNGISTNISTSPDAFTPLQNAHKQLLSSLRADETSNDADLARRLTAAAPVPYVYDVDVSPSQVKMRPKLEHSHSIPLPSFLSEEVRRRMKISSRMGLLNEAGLVWLSIDSTLYLWAYEDSSGENDFCSFDGTGDGQCIVSVALVRPKKGVFKPVVKWCLVVTTPVEIILLALARDGKGESASGRVQNSSMRLFPTRFVLPTDHISMISITGSRDGRIFLGGQDGHLYEMVYGYDDDDGTSHDGMVPSSSMQSSKTAKRLFSLVSGGGSSGIGFHCYKVNHTGSLWTSLIPTTVRSSSLVTSVVDNKQAIIDTVVDHDRRSLYTLNMAGEIKVYDLIGGFRCVGTVKTVEACRSYVTSVKQGRMYLSTSSAMFEGGGTAAAAGLGGIDGARRLLNLDDTINGRSRSTFLPVSINIIPERESRTWTIIATSASGIRMYFTSVNNSVSSYGGVNHGPNSRATKLMLCYVKAPPCLSRTKQVGQNISFQQKTDHMRSQKSWHCGDVSLFATSTETNGNDEGDTLICALSDYASIPKKASENLDQAKTTLSSVSKGAHSTELVYPLSDPSLTLPGGKVWEIVGEFDNNSLNPAYYSRSLSEQTSYNSGPKSLPAPFIPTQESVKSSGFGISSIIRGDYLSPAAKRRKVHNSNLSRVISPIPDVTPLPALATRVTPKRILVLTSGTLHIYTYKSVWDSLYEHILTSSTDSLKQWIDAYGELEAVCMMLHLGSTHSEEGVFINRCIDAIVKYGFVPSTPISDPVASSNPTSHSVMHSMSVSMQGMASNPSVLQSALYQNAARIIRPIWQTPAIICCNIDELTVISDYLCDNAQSQISGLIKIMRKGLAEVVETDPFTSGTSHDMLSHEGTISMDTDEEVREDWITSRQTPVQRRTQIYHRGGTPSMIGNNQSHFNPSKQKQMERENLHGLYRLLTRTNHLLSLLRILRYSNSSKSQISWGQLHNISIADLVCNPVAQERVDLLLDGFLESDDSNQTLLNQLQQQCYLYYSEGVRFLAMGYACEGSASAKLFRLAARYWKSPTLILSTNSPLKSLCDFLIIKKRVSEIVDVSLVAAANFGGTLRGTAAEKDDDATSYRSNMMTWESGLYQSRGIVASTSSSTGTSMSPASTSAASARKKCYTIIFDNLHELLMEPSTLDLADEMLNSCNKSMDELFHHSLYGELIEKGHVDTLLRLRGPILRSWLEMECEKSNGKVNHELLWRYFSIHGEHAEAARIIVEAASKVDHISLDRRIAYLTRGVGSYSSLQQNGAPYAFQQLEDVQSRLDVANVQSRVLSTILSNSELSSKLGATELEKLSKNIISADELLNNYAAPLQLWEFCLIIIHCCRSRGESFDATIVKLWRTILSEIIPLTVSFPQQNIHAAKLLNRIHERCLVVKQDDGTKFEEGRWILPLKTKIVTLGNELYGSGADHTFPLLLLVGELESLRRVYNSCKNADKASTSWSLLAFLEVGCPYPSLIQVYDQLLQSVESEGADIDERVHFISCFAEAVSSWISHAHVWADGPGSERNQLSRALGGGLRSAILSYKSKLEVLVGGDSDEIARILASFERIDQLIRNM